MALSLPSTVRTWQYTSVTGGLEKNLKLNSLSPPSPKSTQHLIRIIAVALNPIDYKPAEIPLIGRFLVPRSATPGIDFSGIVITPASGSSLKAGALVFGAAGTSPVAAGGLSECAVAEATSTAVVPDGVNPVDAATIPVAGLTALQSIVPHVKSGDHVFINGGSGGTGVFGIQIARAVGCRVTTSCSTANVQFCRSLGAEEVVDYKKGSVIEALKESGIKFDHVVDNVGTDPDLYWKCHEWTKEGAKYIMVGGAPSWGHIGQACKRKVWSRKREFQGFWPKPDVEDLRRIVEWMKEGKVRAVVDSKFGFEEARGAFERLKTGRSKGKVVVDVVGESWKDW